MNPSHVEIELTRDQIEKMYDALLIEDTTVTLDAHNELFHLHVTLKMEGPKPCKLCGHVKEV